MKILDTLRKYGVEIEKNDDKYILTINSSDAQDAKETHEITEDEANIICMNYQALDGLDIRHSVEGKAQLKVATTNLKNIVFSYRNKARGLHES